MTDDRKAAFLPSIDRSTRVLILGSLPGEMSLSAHQYYANPTNQFWPLVGALIGADLAALPYEARLRRLLAAGVGLWDVVKSARRTGSGDGAIRDHEANPLAEFVATLPKLEAIGFNGGKASAIGRSQLGQGVSAALITLPSSSAAYCSIGFAAKRVKWLELNRFLRKAAA